MVLTISYGVKSWIQGVYCSREQFKLVFLLPTKTMISANHCFDCFSWPVWAVALGRYRIAPLVSDIRTWVDRIDEVPSQQNMQNKCTFMCLFTFGHQSRGHGPVPRLSPRLSRKPEWKRNANTLCLCKQSVLMQSMVWARPTIDTRSLGNKISYLADFFSTGWNRKLYPLEPNLHQVNNSYHCWP